MSKEWERAVQQEMPEGLRKRILETSGSALEDLGNRNISRDRRNFFSWLTSPFHVGLALGSAGCAVALAIFVLSRAEAPPANADADLLANDLEMVQNSEILLDLQVLKNLDRLKEESKGKWPKRKS